MITPPPLSKGDAVMLIAPGRKIDQKSIEIATKTLESWGLNVLQSEHLFSTDHAYFSANDSSRLRDLQSAINKADVRAIICARGGYGTTRILDGLSLENFKKNPKWIVGFSDITALHLKLLHEGIKSIHGTMPVMFGSEESVSSTESLRRALVGEAVEISFPATSTQSFSLSGSMVGGNLSLIVDSLGTQSEIDTTGKILIVEEIDEYLYRIDRMLVQLDRAGKLSNLKALIVGHFTDLKDTEQSFGESVREILLNHTHKYKYPVLFNFPSGHENPNIAWIQGGEASLVIEKDFSVLKQIN